MSKFIRKVFLVSVITILALGMSGTIFAQETKRTVTVKIQGDFLLRDWPDVEGLVDNYSASRGYWTTGTSLAVFEYLNPTVKIEYIGAGELLTQLAGGTAPSTYNASGAGVTWIYSVIEYANKGLFLDITDYVEKDWDESLYKNLPNSLWSRCLYRGRYYGVPSSISVPVITYRTDWLEEAGIFNAKGEPAVPDNWTMDDLLAIAKKISNPKEMRWGYTFRGGARAAESFRAYATMFAGLNNLIVRPDPTGEYNFRAFFNSPEIKPVVDFYRESIKSGACIYGPEYTSTGTAFQTHQRTWMQPFDWVFHTGRESFWQKSMGAGGPGIVRMAVYPLGLGDQLHNELRGGVVGINPTLSKEEADATWEWLKYTLCGPGVMYNAMTAYGTDMFYAGTYAQIKALGLPDYPGSEIIPKENIEILNTLLNAPAKPPMPDFKLAILNDRRLNAELNAPIQFLLNNPDGDIMKELDKCAELVNKVVLNEKIEGTGMEDIKDYYTACKDFYEKNSPEFYKNYYSRWYENYYKVW